ncbi:MAG: hypothetical protein AB8B48_05865 [Pseudomonadales bacterium]
MTYLIGQIVVCLILALLLGAAFGWWLRSSAARTREAFLQEDLRVANGRLTDTEGEYRRTKARFEEVEAERAQVSMRCITLEKATAEQMDELEVCRAEIIELNNSLAGKEQRIIVIEKEGRYWQKQAPLLQSEIGKLQSTIADLEKNQAASEGRMPILETEIHDTEEKLNQFQEQYDALQREHADLTIAAQSKDKKIRSVELLLASQTSKTDSALQAKDNLQRELDALRTRSAPIVASAEQLPESTEELEQHKRKIEELQAALQDCQQARARTESAVPATPQQAELEIPEDDGIATESKLFTERPLRVDNLKRIKGIGPKLETMLNDLGIYQFEQIAMFTLKDLAWIDDNLSAFKGRAKRDNWVLQAAGLQ